MVPILLQIGIVSIFYGLKDVLEDCQRLLLCHFFVQIIWMEQHFSYYHVNNVLVDKPMHRCLHPTKMRLDCVLMHDRSILIKKLGLVLFAQRTIHTSTSGMLALHMQIVVIFARWPLEVLGVAGCLALLVNFDLATEMNTKQTCNQQDYPQSRVYLAHFDTILKAMRLIEWRGALLWWHPNNKMNSNSANCEHTIFSGAQILFLPTLGVLAPNAEFKVA